MASSADKLCQRALIGVVRQRILAASREPSDVLDDAMRARLVELVGSTPDEHADPSTAGALLGHVFAEWDLGRDEVLVLAAALTAELSPPLLRALCLLGGHPDDRRLSVEAVAALLAPGDAGVVRAHQLLRRQGPLTDLCLVWLGDTARPFPAQTIVIDPRLIELSLGVRAPAAPLGLFERLPAPRAVADALQTLRDALERRAPVVALLPAPLDIARLAADLGPGALLALPLAHLDDPRATGAVLREARIFDATIAVTVDRVLSAATLTALTALGSGGRRLVCVGTSAALLTRLPAATQVDLVDIYSIESQAPRTLATVAGPAAILPPSIDSLNQGEARASALIAAPPSGDEPLTEAAAGAIKQAAAAWAARAPGTFRVGIVGPEPPARLACRLVTDVGLRPVLLPCDALVALDDSALERTWTDARNAASHDCGVVVVLDETTPRRVIRADLLEGGLFVLVGPHAAAAIIEPACDQLHRFGKAEAIDDLLAFAHGADS